MSERRLLITADDLGMSRGINDAIQDGVEAGLVTSAGLLANGAALDAARCLVSHRVALGIHFNLTEGRCLAGRRQVPSLVHDDGSFYSLTGLLVRAVVGLVQSDHVTREFAAQVHRLRELGYPITYADSHQHIHAQPRLAGPIARAVRQAGLGKVRRATDWSWGPGGKKAWVIAASMRTSEAHFVRLARSDAARGIARRATDLDQWEQILASLPPGVTELIVHLRRPGPREPGEERMSDMGKRQAEWRTLTDPRARDVLTRSGVQLA